MILIDSCHDSWFAKWYISNLFKIVNDLIFIQDIAFYDRENIQVNQNFYSKI